MFTYRNITKVVFALVIFTMLYGCTDNSESNDIMAENAIHLTVHKRNQCNCCSKWIHHMRDNGFSTTSNSHNNLSSIKKEFGIHKKLSSCHTSITDDGFVFEGHIPAKFIQSFLDEKPEGARGLAVPGMPTGTPGMEFRDMFQPYKIYLLKNDGSVEIYAEVNSAEEQL